MITEEIIFRCRVVREGAMCAEHNERVLALAATRKYSKSSCSVATGNAPTRIALASPLSPSLCCGGIGAVCPSLDLGLLS